MTKKWLKEHGFRHNRIFSDKDMEAYSVRFPVYRYGMTISLECEATVILGEDGVILNVYDYGTRDKYAPFYCGTYNKTMNIIWDNITKQLSKWRGIWK